ncbi:iron permease FTR1/Fip1/EfeU [Lipomyces kononenkoae]|uniref:Iron permease FTR1/Fip1/EfeU n=1 Tax=Lipomyces kononenkoae TaxID=34357 RepID=A0ACC3T0D3_LIPKO
MVQIFDVSVFFIVFRESLEAAVVISVLLAFIKQGVGRSAEDPTVYKQLVRHVWVGAAIGFAICLIIGGAFVGTWYTLGTNAWGASEDIWEGVLSIVATIIISVVGLAMLRLNKMKEKWRIKISKALADKDVRGKNWFRRFTRKYAMGFLPFITILREGIEAIVFVGGVALSSPARAFPLPVVCGLAAGGGIGYLLYKGGDYMKIQYFLIVATCFLYLVAAGLFSKGVWFLENFVWSNAVGGDVAETGDGPGSYDVRLNVWHVNCCNGQTSGGWMIFNAIFGWQNSATYGSVISYNAYWIGLMVSVVLMLFKEKHGHFPLLKSWTEKRRAAKLARRQKKRLEEAEKESAQSHDTDSETKEVRVSVV